MAEDKNIFLDPNNPSLPQVNQAPVGVQTQSVQPQYAGYWVRIVAAYIDGAFFGILTAPFNFGLSKLLPQPDPVIVGNLIGNNSFAFAVVFLFKVWVPLLISGIITLAIAIYFITRYGGTPGKIFFGAKIVDGSGKYINVKRAIRREVLGKFISNLTFGIGYSMVAFSKQKRGLHDKIAGTYVVLTKPLSRWKKILVFIFAALPTIAIIGIIAAAVLIAINPAKRQSQAQDVNRKSHISQIGVALLLYKDTHGEYPESLNDLVTSGTLKSVPVDPYRGQYKYLTVGDKSSSVVYASLEAGEKGGFAVWCWTSESMTASEVRSASDCEPKVPPARLRDIDRKNDIAQLATALNSYFTLKGQFPQDLSFLVSEGDLVSVPIDPNGQSYTYLISSIEVSVFALLETGSSPNAVWCWRSAAGRAIEMPSPSGCVP